MLLPSGFFVFRTPLLPTDELQRFSEGLSAGSAPPEKLSAALDEDRRTLRQRLARLIERPEVREALFLASPTLLDSLPFWREAPDSERGQKVERTLIRYFARMAGRATPYGLFAGHAVGSLASATNLALGPLKSYRRHTRLDMDYVWALTSALAKDPALQKRLRYFPNSSLYTSVDGRLHYAEARVHAVRGRSYHLVAVEATSYLLATLARARTGTTLPALAKALIIDDLEISDIDAERFLAQLVSSQLLVAEIEPAVTGPEPIPLLLAELSRHLEDSTAAATYTRLAETHVALETLDREGLGASPERYREIAQRLGELPVPIDISRLYQVDLEKPAPDATLGSAVVKELQRAVELLHAIGSKTADPLSGFRADFLRRYESREVPLVEVLDSETGIEFGGAQSLGSDASPLLEGLALHPTPTPLLRADSARDVHLIRRLEEVLRAGSHELVLDEADIKALRQDGPPLAKALHVIATLAAASGEACARGEFELLLEGSSGPSGANLLGRFCHADRELNRRVEAHLRAEEALQKEAIFAELVHLPQGRLGNILSRPLLREYEIVYLGRSGAPLDRQLPISDLLVSVSDGRIRLRSARLGREVIPRLTTAHNYSMPGNVPLYRFLASVGHAEVASSSGWYWGLLENAPFLPRVRHGRIILSPARWNIVGGLAELGRGAAADRFAATQQFRARHRLPRCVLVVDHDNRLPIDFDNALMVESFVQLVKRRPWVQLIEQLPAPERLCARGPEGAFVHQLIVPFVQERAAAPPPLEPAWPESPRRFALGSEWLYTKIYTGAAGADRVLNTVIAPLVASLVPTVVSRWFFIRYSDPDWHLRVRFMGDPARLHGEVLPALLAKMTPLLNCGIVHRLAFDTYEREVERYGGPAGILLAEELFHADSEAALTVVRMLTGDAGKQARWKIALRGLHDLLSAFAIDLQERQSLLRLCRESAARSYSGFEPALGEKFRKLRPELTKLIEGPPPPWHQGAVITEVARRFQAHDLLRPSILGSFLHMHVNRLLRASAVAHELVLYDFLLRLYESKLAMQRRN